MMLLLAGSAARSRGLAVMHVPAPPHHITVLHSACSAQQRHGDAWSPCKSAGGALQPEGAAESGKQGRFASNDIDIKSLVIRCHHLNAAGVPVTSSWMQSRQPPWRVSPICVTSTAQKSSELYPSTATALPGADRLRRPLLHVVG